MNKRKRELLAKRQELIEEHEKILKVVEDEKRHLTSEDKERLNAILAETENLNEEIRHLDKQAEMVRAAGARDAPQGGPASPGQPDPDPSDPGTNGQHFGSIGEQFQAMATSAAERRADPRQDAIHAEVRALGLSEGVPADGGFLVQTDFATELLRRTYETGILLSRVRRQPISAAANSIKINAIDETSRADGSRFGGVQMYWAAEADAKTKSKPKIRQVELNLQKLIGLIYVTDELLQDAVALSAFIQEMFPLEAGFKADDGIINGTGAGQLLGVMTGGSLVSVAKETGQAASTLLSENVEKMYSRVWSPSLRNAVWYINMDVWPQIFQLHHVIGTGGVPMFIPAGGLNTTPFGTLLGRPIEPIEQCATLGTKGDIILADLSQYILAEKGGMQAAISIHVQFTTDETVFRFVMRLDGQPWWNKPLTPFKGTNTLSPFVSLDTRA